MKSLSIVSKVLVGLSLVLSLAFLNACGAEKSGSNDDFAGSSNRAKLGSNSDASKNGVQFNSDAKNGDISIGSGAANGSGGLDANSANGNNGLDAGKESMDPEIAERCNTCQKKCESISRVTECGKKKFDQCMASCNEQNQNMCVESSTTVAQLF